MSKTFLVPLLLQFNRFCSKITNNEVLKHRAKIFDEEKKRQV